jgi:drug/metabolite transporter (DMT)-like permease
MHSPDAIAAEARRQRSGHIALGVVQVCFALFPIFGKLAFENGAFSPLAVGSWRMMFASTTLLVAALVVHARKALPAVRDLPWLAMLSFLGVTANMVLYLEGLQRSTATNAALTVCLIPVFTFAIAAIAKHETFAPMRVVGLSIALFGASMLFWAERPDLASAHAVGNFLMSLNTLSYAAYLVLSRPMLKRYPPLVVIAWVFVLSLPWVPFLAHGEVLVPTAVSTRAWGSLVFILIFPTSLAYLLNSFALSRLRASTTAMYVYVQPLITGFLGWLFFDDEITVALLSAAACIFVGIYLVARRPSSARVAAAGSAEAS